jgi:hypothetical protein
MEKGIASPFFSLHQAKRTGAVKGDAIPFPLLGRLSAACLGYRMGDFILPFPASGKSLEMPLQMHWKEPATADDSHAALEKKLWDAPNMLRAGADLKPTEYSPTVLGLISPAKTLSRFCIPSDFLSNRALRSDLKQAA